jgi:hypothetical protein
MKFWISKNNLNIKTCVYKEFVLIQNKTHTEKQEPDLRCPLISGGDNKVPFFCLRPHTVNAQAKPPKNQQQVGQEFLLLATFGNKRRWCHFMRAAMRLRAARKAKVKNAPHAGPLGNQKCGMLHAPGCQGSKSEGCYSIWAGTRYF